MLLRKQTAKAFSGRGELSEKKHRPTYNNNNIIIINYYYSDFKICKLIARNSAVASEPCCRACRLQCTNQQSLHMMLSIIATYLLSVNEKHQGFTIFVPHSSTLQCSHCTVVCDQLALTIGCLPLIRKRMPYSHAQLFLGQGQLRVVAFNREKSLGRCAVGQCATTMSFVTPRHKPIAALDQTFAGA